jgi:hypothetical protein
VLDRERDPVGDDLEQIDVVPRELARRERAHVENAEDLVREDERDAGHALDPLLPQDGVQDVRMVDVVEHDRVSRRRDPARKPAADRNPNVLLDLLLEPDCCARHELVPELVAQEDRGRVGLEHVSNPGQQLGEEVVQVQVRERGIRDELEPPQQFGVTPGTHGRTG